jgi:voltage-gated potassium channel
MIHFLKKQQITQPSQKTMENSMVGKRGKKRLLSGAYRYSVACFLGALVLMYVATPLIEKIDEGDHIVGFFLTLVLLSAVPAVGNSRRAMVWAIVLVIPAVAAKWLHHLWPTVIHAEFWLVPGLFFVIFVIMHLFGFIFRASQVDSEVMCAAIAGYLLLAMVWGFAYILIADLVPGSFVFTAGPASSQVMKGFTALYFSFVTLCTVGYGDIVPVSGVARSLAMIEAAVGVFYIATIISRLVAVYSSKSVSNGKPL